MNTDNKKLGRGLGSLLSPNKTDEKKFKFINISQIKANKDQPRKNFKKEELKELSTSIKTQGILQPIVVRPLYDSGDYEIIAGERRWRAAQIAGVHEIPCLIKILNNQAVQEAALIENIQRENLNVVEEANAYKNILNEKNIDQDKLSLLIGKSKSHISNLIRLLDLEEDILNFIIEGKISMGHARALIGVPNAIDLANEIIDKKLSVRQVEKNTSGFKKNLYIFWEILPSYLLLIILVINCVNYYFVSIGVECIRSIFNTPFIFLKMAFSVQFFSVELPLSTKSAFSW